LTLESSLSSFESTFSLSVFLTSIIRRSSASNSWPTWNMKVQFNFSNQFYQDKVWLTLF
jgi:hypothetical protein